jgi:hypothetical protein
VIVLEEANAFLDTNPVCPALPPEIAMLDPHFQSGAPRELGGGGIGAALSGSVDTSAPTLISLLALAKARGMLERQK